MKNYLVYLHKFLDGSLYVGQGQNRRPFDIHWRSNKWKKLYDLYGMPTVTILHRDLDVHESHLLELKEFELLSLKNIMFQSRPKGYKTNRVISPEIRKRISESLTGKKREQRVVSEETRRKLSEFQKGKKRGPRSEETRKKISENMKNSVRVHSDETKRKISSALKGKKKKPVSEIHRKKLSESREKINSKIRIEVLEDLQRAYKDVKTSGKRITKVAVANLSKYHLSTIKNYWKDLHR